MERFFVLIQVFIKMLVIASPFLVVLSVLLFIPVNTAKGKRSLLVVLAKALANTLK